MMRTTDVVPLIELHSVLDQISRTAHERHSHVAIAAACERLAHLALLVRMPSPARFVLTVFG